MNSCTYWSAGHVTAFFIIADLASDLLHKGSCGGGFNIKRGVKTEISKATTSDHRIFFNSNPQFQDSVSITDFIIKELESVSKSVISPLNIHYNFQVPIGAGYGTSASAALTTAFAINDLLNLGVSELNLWQIAQFRIL